MPIPNARISRVCLVISLLCLFNNVLPAQDPSAFYRFYRDETIRTGNTAYKYQLAVGFLCNTCASPQDDIATRLASRLIHSSTRTNNQIGTTTSKRGATTLTENTGFEELLALAIEQGAVAETHNGSTITLSTTPYMIATGLGTADTASNWEHLSFLRRLGINASFQASGETGSIGAFEGTEIKYAVMGSRTARDAALAITAGRVLADPLVQVATRLNVTLANLTANIPLLDSRITELSKWIEAKRLPAGRAGLDAAAPDMDTEMAKLFADVPAAQIAELRAAYLAMVDVVVAEDTTAAKLKELTDIYLKRGASLSVAYQYQTQSVGSALSTIKLLVAYDAAPSVQANLNANVDLNNSATGAAGHALETVNSYGAQGGLTFGRFAANKADVSFEGEVQRQRQQSDAAEMTTASFQAKMNLYLTPTVTIPIATTYVSQTAIGAHSHWHFNIGLSLSGDSLLGVGAK